MEPIAMSLDEIIKSNKLAKKPTPGGVARKP